MSMVEIILDSGLVEQYVLGQLTEQEESGLLCLANTFPEIKNEIEILQKSLEEFAVTYKKDPPATLKKKVFDQLRFDENDAGISIPPVTGDTALDKPLPKIPAAVKEKFVVRKISLLYKAGWAAAILLGAWAAWTVVENNKLRQNQAIQQEQLTRLQKVSENQLQVLELYKNPDVKICKLAGVDNYPSGNAIVHWNKKASSIALEVNNLPVPRSGFQYQLWYIGEKGPVDLGIIDNAFNGKILAMKNIKGNPQAFAITLEKAGGAEKPTLTQMYALGNI